MEENIPQRSAFERLLPTEDGYSAATTIGVTAAASLIDLNGEWGLSSEQPSEEYITRQRLKRGGAWVSIGATGGDLSVRRVRATAIVPGTTAANGFTIEDGKIEDFWIDSSRPLLDIVGTAAMTAFVYFSSRNINGGKSA